VLAYLLRRIALGALVVVAVGAGSFLRLTVALVRDEREADHVRTAVAKGLSPRRVITHHAAPGTYVATASLVGVSVPLVVTNMVLVEKVFSVQGFFFRTWKASGHTAPFKEQTPDFPTLQGIAVWAAVLIVFTGLVVDLVIAQLDPRIRASSRAIG
jgi:peptide/nickel transport system permease protein